MTQSGRSWWAWQQQHTTECIYIITSDTTVINNQNCKRLLYIKLHEQPTSIVPCLKKFRKKITRTKYEVAATCHELFTKTNLQLTVFEENRKVSRVKIDVYWKKKLEIKSILHTNKVMHKAQCKWQKKRKEKWNADIKPNMIIR